MWWPFSPGRYDLEGIDVMTVNGGLRLLLYVRRVSTPFAA